MKDSIIGQGFSKEKLFDLMLENSPMTIYWMSKEGIYLGCSKLMAKLLGYDSPKNVIGKSNKDLLSEPHLSEINKNNEAVLCEGREITVEECGLDEHGNDAIFLTKKTPVFGDAGDIIGLFGVSLNISEKKLADKVLKNRGVQAFQELNKVYGEVFGQKPKKPRSSVEELSHIIMLLQNIIAELPNSVYVKDKHGNFLSSNDNNARILGFNRASELIGKNDSDFLDPELLKKIRENDRLVMDSKTTKTIEEVGFDCNRKEAIYITTKKPIFGFNASPVGVLGISVDITKERQAERYKSERNAAQAQIKTLELLAASMAHELRTPLATIDTGLAVAETHFPVLVEAYKQSPFAELDSPPIESMDLPGLEGVISRSRKATRTSFEIVDMLVFKSGLSTIDPSKFGPCSIESCVQKALDRYPLTDKERKLIQWEPNDFNFTGDEPLITHVLFNLLKNGIYYVKAAGKGNIRIWLEEKNEANELHFKDTGQGVPPDVLPNIFEPFYTTLSHGTGVGLAFSKLVMEAHKGKVTCQSELGNYTEFTLVFPKP